MGFNIKITGILPLEAQDRMWGAPQPHSEEVFEHWIRSLPRQRFQPEETRPDSRLLRLCKLPGTEPPLLRSWTGRFLRFGKLPGQKHLIYSHFREACRLGRPTCLWRLMLSCLTGALRAPCPQVCCPHFGCSPLSARDAKRRQAVASAPVCLHCSWWLEGREALLPSRELSTRWPMAS